jgi:hypothetical protein
MDRICITCSLVSERECDNLCSKCRSFRPIKSGWNGICWEKRGKDQRCTSCHANKEYLYNNDCDNCFQYCEFIEDCELLNYVNHVDNFEPQQVYKKQKLV